MANEITTRGFAGTEPVKLGSLKPGTLICGPGDNAHVAYIKLDHNRCADLGTGKIVPLNGGADVVPLNFVELIGGK
jgi:hypothetical protein